MRIYPDTDLPNLEVTWEPDCRDSAADVRVVLYRWGTQDVLGEMSAPCTDGEMHVVDIAREHYRVNGYLLDISGGVLDARQGSEVDMRNGLDARLPPMTFSFSNLKIAWSFADGASCESVHAGGVIVQRLNGTDFTDEQFALCEDSPLFTYTGGGPARLRMQALGDYGPVATSEVTPELVFTYTERTDAGTVTLVPN